MIPTRCLSPSLGNKPNHELNFQQVALAVAAPAGTVSIDTKLRRALGPASQSFVAQTSILPFAPIAAGRNWLNLVEIAPWRWAAALAAYVLFLGSHCQILSVSPILGWEEQSSYRWV
jgi:uncharacterized membrane protein